MRVGVSERCIVMLPLMALLTLCLVYASGSHAQETRLAGYRFQNNTPWGYQIVSGFARAGTLSQRFEVRAGDCGYTPKRIFNDCDNGHERSQIELKKNIRFPGDVWFGWSIYVPKDYTNGPLFQSKIFNLKMRDGPPRVEQFASDSFVDLVSIQIEEQRLTVCVYRFSRTADGWRDECDKTKSVSLKELRGRWTDLTLNYNSNGAGSLTLYINGKARAQETGFVAFDVDEVYLAYGIYRPSVARTNGTVPTQVMYVDEMRIGSTQGEVAISDENPVD